MWLINVESRKLENFMGKPPPYGILSHRWEEDEVTFQDMQSGEAEDKKGYRKIDMFCKQFQGESWAKHVWVDTCCIDKSNNSELSEAINSMYNWYSRADGCSIYLSDVTNYHDASADFTNSAWFTRGWTLQELLAPNWNVRFYNCDWDLIGSRSDLREQISEVTGIPIKALEYGFQPSRHSITDRMSWAANRRTTREEDMAYCLLGIFEVNMPLIYGEGKRAFHRLQEEILRVSEDLSIFAWQGFGRPGFEILPEAPSSFRREGDLLYGLEVVNTSHGFGSLKDITPQGTAITNAGIVITINIIPFFLDTYLVPVCKSGSQFVCVCITRDPEDGYFRKVLIDGKQLVEVDLRVAKRGEVRRVVLGRGAMVNLGLELRESYYRFEVLDVTPSVLEQFQKLSTEPIKDLCLDATLDIVSRFDATSHPRSLLMRPGSAGVAGMLRFRLSDQSIILLFGHDFDFDLFCLVLQADLPNHDEVIHFTTVSIPDLQETEFNLASNDDMMTLVSAMQHETRKTWSLKRYGVELHQIPWAAMRFTQCPLLHQVSTFAVAGLIQVSVTRAAHTVYTIEIDKIPKASASIAKAYYDQRFDEWHVQSWGYEPSH